MSYLFIYRSIFAGLASAIALALMGSCGGSVNPALGARLIFEEQLTDQLKAQIILEDRDLLKDDDEDESYYGY
jgi:hypothetical protein